MTLTNIKYADVNQRELYKKFPSTHYLSNPQNLNNTYLWCTFFRRNLHRFVQDYLGIKLHLYQQLIIYLMGINEFITIIACRAAAKSFIVALFACCRAILRPSSKIVLGSATRGQSKLIITEKIEAELMQLSPPLRREIKNIVNNANETYIYFYNGSTIKVFTANDRARGLRSNVAIREEFRQIDKSVDDKIISPFQCVRQQPYMLDPYYAKIPELRENPVDIYISSSWFDDGHWMWDIVDLAYSSMLKGEPYILLAFDESITLKHNIRTQKQMQNERRKQDPVTWQIEFLNLRVRNNASAFFPYKILTENQVLEQVFYPSKQKEVSSNTKSRYVIPKQNGEIRVISCDIAFVEGDENDNSIYSCIRGIPESLTYQSSGGEVEIKQGYKRQYPYMESNQMGDTTKQAIRIRQLMEDFKADYIVLDCRNGGTQVLYSLGKTLYDAERGVEYPPLKCMNNEKYANFVKNPNAPAVIYAINATSQLNNDIAYSFRSALTEHRIEFLVNYNVAKEEILSRNKDYINEKDIDLQFEYEKPFLETQAMISECAELLSEKSAQTGIVKVYEHGRNRKDRYTSCSYGNYFFDLLETDIGANSSEYDYGVFID